jgi:cation transport ATPase
MKTTFPVSADTAASAELRSEHPLGKTIVAPAANFYECRFSENHIFKAQITATQLT